MPDPSPADLELALTWHLTRELLDADLNLDPQEAQFLADRFPQSTLQAAGFVHEDGAPTDRFQAVLAEALVVLPERMSEDDKAVILRMLFSASLVDDDFHRQEGHVLAKAAQLLGLSLAQLDAALEISDDVGTVDLPDPES